MIDVQHDLEAQEFYVDTPQGKAILHYEREGKNLNYFFVKQVGFFVFVVMILMWHSFAFSEEIPIRIDGKVIRVDEAKRLLVIDFEHPATGEHTEREFVVSEGAGFKDFKKLSQLKKGDLVSLDYYQYSTVAQAIYIMHIPIEKTYFTHKEVAQALVQIKSNQKDDKAQ